MRHTWKHRMLNVHEPWGPVLCSSSVLGSSLLLLFWLRSQRMMTVGQDQGRWAAGMSTLNGPALLANSARQSHRTTCLQGRINHVVASCCCLHGWLASLGFIIPKWIPNAFLPCFDLPVICLQQSGQQAAEASSQYLHERPAELQGPEWQDQQHGERVLPRLAPHSPGTHGTRI